jgi:hypothetical protein
LAQVQVVYWERFLRNANTFILLRAFLDPKMNYDVCAYHLQLKMADKHASPQSIVAMHVGEARCYYLAVFKTCLSWLGDLIK